MNPPKAEGRDAGRVAAQQAHGSDPREVYAVIHQLTHPRNWTEDYQHENGRYLNHCFFCKLPFQGHKRRVCCKVCADQGKEDRPGQQGREGQHTERTLAERCQYEADIHPDVYGSDRRRKALFAEVAAYLREKERGLGGGGGRFTVK